MEAIYTIDIVTGEKISINAGVRVIADYVHNHFIFGQTVTSEPIVTIRVYIENRWLEHNILVSRFTKYIVYDCSRGDYFLNINVPLKETVMAKFCKRSGFPYSFSKKYEAVENFNLFDHKQKVLENINFPIAKYFKYTFGLEFETSTGIIPEDICFRDGLIPLRDGSISGNEYSTVILSGNEGFNLMYQQIKTLRKYTRFDKECSLHIHIGGFPLEPQKILSLYNLCFILESEIKTILPRYTFYTSKYKASHKDYCKLLPRSFDSFEDFYTAFTTNRFFGSLEQAHPHDIDRSRKWQIHERYYWANLLNLICYKVNKTMEFRMLRPTYNLEKILFWMYVFNAIMIVAETKTITSKDHLKINDILSCVYPADLVETLMIDYYKCMLCSEEQYSYFGDCIGERIDIENEFFEKDKIF